MAELDPNAPPAAADALAGFMPPNVAEAARHAVAAGHWTPEQARRELEGFDPKAIDAALAGAQPEANEDLADLNRGGFVGARDPSEIKVSYDPDTIAHMTPAQFQRFDAEIKQGMCEMGVPAVAAGNLITLIANTAFKLQSMSTDERTAWSGRQKADMVAVMGDDGAKAAHANAAQAFGRIANTDLMANLLATGVLDDAMLVTVLSQTQGIAKLREAVRGGQSLTSFASEI